MECLYSMHTKEIFLLVFNTVGQFVIRLTYIQHKKTQIRLFPILWFNFKKNMTFHLFNPQYLFVGRRKLSLLECFWVDVVNNTFWFAQLILFQTLSLVLLKQAISLQLNFLQFFKKPVSLKWFHLLSSSLKWRELK